MFQTLHLMKFFFCTAYVDSSTLYGRSLDILPFQGVCQGNGASPAVWLALSICLIYMLHTYGHTSSITSAITVATLALSGLLYVDDSDLFILALPFRELSLHPALAGGPLGHWGFPCS